MNKEYENMNNEEFRNMSNEEFQKMLEELIMPQLDYRSVKKDYPQDQTVNAEICKKCGGRCCQKCGCHFSPDDFEEISFEYLKKQLEKGYISIDYVDGEAIYQEFGVYILRMRNKGKSIVDFSYQRSPCILWTKNGCQFDYEHRPSGGKLLIPSAEIGGLLEQHRRCSSLYGVTDCCYEWKPHQKVLHELIEYFKEKDFPCSLEEAVPILLP